MIRPSARALVKIIATTYLTSAVLGLAPGLPVCSVSSAAVEVLYAPHDAPLDRLVTLYQHARRYIYVSVYGLTYPRAVKALVAAKKRGVDVRMLTDQERTQEVKQRT